MHHARYMHVLFFNDNVNDDVNDFVIVEKHTSRSLVIVIVFLGFATFTHPNRRSTLQSMKVIVFVEKHTSRSLVIVNVIVFVHAFAWPHGSPIISNISLT